MLYGHPECAAGTCFLPGSTTQCSDHSRLKSILTAAAEVSAGSIGASQALRKQDKNTLTVPIKMSECYVLSTASCLNWRSLDTMRSYYNSGASSAPQLLVLVAQC